MWQIIIYLPQRLLTITSSLLRQAARVHYVRMLASAECTATHKRKGSYCSLWQLAYVQCLTRSIAIVYVRPPGAAHCAYMQLHIQSCQQEWSLPTVLAFATRHLGSPFASLCAIKGGWSPQISLIKKSVNFSKTVEFEYQATKRVFWERSSPRPKLVRLIAVMDACTCIG